MPTYGKPVYIDDYADNYRPGDSIDDVYNRLNAKKEFAVDQKAGVSPGKWTPERITALYNFAHSPDRPAELDDTAIQIIDTANTYALQSKGAALPSELTLALDSFEPYAPPPQSDPNETQAGPYSAMTMVNYQQPKPGPAAGQTAVQNPETYGYTPEQWESLQDWQRRWIQFGNLSGPTQMAGMAVATGAPEIVLGAKSPGAVVGAALKVGTFGYVTGLVSEKAPWLGNIVNIAFNKLAEETEKYLGLRRLLGAARSKEYDISVADIIRNYDAAMQVVKYQYEIPSDIEEKKESMYWDAWSEEQKKEILSVDPFRETVWHIGDVESNVLPDEEKGRAAMVDFFNRLDNGTLTPEQLADEIEQKYGEEGRVRDLVNQIILDPQNFFGLGGVRLWGGKAAKALGLGLQFTQGFLGSAGPGEALRRGKELSKVTQTLPEAKSHGTVWNYFLGQYTKEGKPKGLETTPSGFRGAVSKGLGLFGEQNRIQKSWDYLTNLDPKSKATEWMNGYTLITRAISAEEGGDYLKTHQRHVRLANGGFDRAADTSMKALNGPYAAFIPLAEKSWINEGETLIKNYDALEPQRDLIQKIIDGTGHTPEETLKDLVGIKEPKKAETLLARLKNTAASRGDAGAELVALIDSGGISSDTLKKLGKIFVEDGNPRTKEMMDAFYQIKQEDHLAKFIADWFKVKEDPLWVRISDTIKNIQGALVLDLSWSYLFQNSFNNITMMIEDGAISFAPPGKRADFYKRWGVKSPETKMTFMETETGMRTADSPIYEAAKPSGRSPLEKYVNRPVRWARGKFGIGGVASAHIEQGSREVAHYAGLQRARSALQRVGVGFDKIPKDLARLGTAEEISAWKAILESSVDQEEAMTRLRTMYDGQEHIRGLDEIIDEVVDSVGISDVDAKDLLRLTDSYDFLSERIGDGKNTAAIHKAFIDLRKRIGTQLDKWQEMAKLAEFEKAANAAKVEGLLGVYDSFSRTFIDFAMQRKNDFNRLDHLFEIRKDVDPKQWRMRLKHEIESISHEQKRLKRNEASILLGIAKHFGADSEQAKRVQANRMLSGENWQEFYGVKNDLLEKLYAKSEEWRDNAQFDKEFGEVSEKIDKAYTRAYKRDLELQADLHKMLSSLIAAKWGDDAGKNVAVFFKKFRDLDDSMFKEMQSHYNSLKGLKGMERRMQWSVFLKDWQLRLNQRMADGLAGSRDIWLALNRMPTKPRPTSPSLWGHNQFVGQARKKWIAKFERLTDYQTENLTAIRKIAAQEPFRIASIDKKGKRITGFEKMILHTVNKYGDQKFATIDELLSMEKAPEIVETALRNMDFERRPAAPTPAKEGGEGLGKPLADTRAERASLKKRLMDLGFKTEEIRKMTLEEARKAAGVPAEEPAPASAPKIAPTVDLPKPNEIELLFNALEEESKKRSRDWRTKRIDWFEKNKGSQYKVEVTDDAVLVNGQKAEPIGQGAEKKVYSIGDGKVLKIDNAKEWGPYSSNVVNEARVMSEAPDSVKNLMPEIYEVGRIGDDVNDKGYHYSIMEEVRMLKPEEFNENAGWLKSLEDVYGKDNDFGPKNFGITKDGRTVIIDLMDFKELAESAEFRRRYNSAKEAYDKQVEEQAAQVEQAPPLEAQVEQAPQPLAKYTPEFLQRFEGSKVVDENGEPLRVYHGTTKDFEGYSIDEVKNPRFGWGFYFADSAEDAMSHASGEGGNVRPAYLDIKNPYEVPEGVIEFDYEGYSGTWLENAKQFTDDLIAQGYDGVVWRRQDGKTHWVAFRPDQIVPYYEALHAPVYEAVPNMAEVIAMADDMEMSRLKTYLDGSVKEAGMDTPEGMELLQPFLDRYGKKGAPEEAVPVDEVGPMIPGGVESLYPPNMQKFLEEGAQDNLFSLLDQMEETMLSERGKRTALNLDPAKEKALMDYFRKQMTRFGDIKIATTRFGEVAANTALLNYQRRYGMDNALAFVMPYHFWTGRTVFNHMIRAIDRPAIYANYMRVRKEQDRITNSMAGGYPDRLRGKLQIKVPGWMVPEGWGDTIYFDPIHQIMSLEGIISQATRMIQRDQTNYIKRALSILQEKSLDETVSREDLDAAVNTRTGPLWDEAYAQAKSEIEANVENPYDVINGISSFSLPISMAVDIINGDWSKRSMTPLERTITDVTSPVVPGGWNPGGWIREALGQPSRDWLFTYYVEKEMGMMAVAHADDPDYIAELERQMVDQDGELWTEAMGRVGKQQAFKHLGSLFWFDMFPEPEQQQVANKQEFFNAMESGDAATFFDEKPEYQAWMLKDNWDDPEVRMKKYLWSLNWDLRYSKDPLIRQQLDEQMPDDYHNLFLNKETRSFDSVNIPTLAQWAQAWGGVLPETAPETPSMGIELPEASLNTAYNEYIAWRDAQPGYALTGVYYNLPQGMQSQFKAAHPEVQAYLEAKYTFGAANPELIPYIISDDNRLSGADPWTQEEVFQFYAEKSDLFPLISITQDRYYSLSGMEQKKFLKQHPELKEYWDWNRERKKMLSNDAFMLVESEEGLKKLREGKDYEKTYYVDYDKFKPDVLSTLAQAALLNRPIGQGTNQALYEMWVKEKKPLGTFNAWLAVVMQGMQWK